MGQGRPWAFTQREGLGLAACLVAALAIALTAAIALSMVRVSNRSGLLEMSKDMLEVERLRRAFSEKTASVRGYALTRDEEFAEGIVRSRRRFLGTLEQLKGRFSEAPGPELLEAVVRAERGHEAAMREMLKLRAADADRERLKQAFEERVVPQRTRVHAALQRLAEHAQQRLALGVAQAQREERWTLVLVLAATLLGLLVVAGLVWVLVRRLRPLRREARASEERLRLLVDGVKDYALVLLDARGRVERWNSGAERITGWTEEEVLGQASAIFYAPEVRMADKPEQYLARTERDGRLRVEGWRVRKDGSRYWAEEVMSALREEDGRLKGFAVVVRDATERRNIERTQKLFAEAGRLFLRHPDPDRTAAELARMMVPEWADGCILFLMTSSGQLRPRAVKHVSAEQERLLWKAIQSPVPEGKLPPGVAQVMLTGQSHRIPEVTPELLAAHGLHGGHELLIQELGLRSMLCVALRVGDISRGVLMLLSSQAERRYSAADQVVVEELAGRAALALENARLFRETQQALEFIGVAAHDLGNPLNTLQLALRRMQRLDAAAEPARLRDGLAAAVRQAQRLGQLLHNLLDLSRLSSGPLTLDEVGVDLGELAREVVERHGEQAAETGSRLVVDAAPGVVGRWDRLRLERVLTNLLSNALKFGRGQPVEVHVSAEGGRARLVVRDYGQGIATEAQRRIFERFERLKSEGQQGGFGLGLYIVRQLVEAHGGAIHVESQPGEGSSFIVELPMAPAHRELEPPPPAPPAS